MNYESSVDIIAAVQAALLNDDTPPVQPLADLPETPAPLAPADPANTSGDDQKFWTLPGICWNARVSTSFGDLPVQALRKRDPLRTPSGEFLPVAHVDELRLDGEFLRNFPDAAPIVISAGALGSGRPANAITVSPHQRVSVGESRLAGDLRMARDLLDRPGVVRTPTPLVRYIVFHCAVPACVMVEGVWVSTAP